jgi:cardiolipin synthase
MTLPNWLTVFRVAMTPVIGYAIARDNFRVALPLLFFAGISDAVDGYIARRFSMSSRLGEKLDPIADKFLLVTVYLALGASGALPLWLVAVVLGRDALILVFAVIALLFTKMREFPPSVWGKISTMLQMLLAGCVVLGRVWPDSFLASLKPLLLWCVVPATVWSGAHYAWLARGRLKQID